MIHLLELSGLLFNPISLQSIYRPQCIQYLELHYKLKIHHLCRGDSKFLEKKSPFYSVPSAQSPMHERTTSQNVTAVGEHVKTAKQMKKEDNFQKGARQ